jgi:hypothetical protein
LKKKKKKKKKFLSFTRTVIWQSFTKLWKWVAVSVLIRIHTLDS